MNKSVDKFGDKGVNKIKPKTSPHFTSPYLQRPLRSLADALAERKGTADLSTRFEPRKLSVSPAPPTDNRTAGDTAA